MEPPEASTPTPFKIVVPPEITGQPCEAVVSGRSVTGGKLGPALAALYFEEGVAVIECEMMAGVVVERLDGERELKRIVVLYFDTLGAHALPDELEGVSPDDVPFASGGEGVIGDEGHVRSPVHDAVSGALVGSLAFPLRDGGEPVGRTVGEQDYPDEH